MNPLSDPLPPDIVLEIVEVLRHFEAFPHGPWEPIQPQYMKWRELIRSDGYDLLDHAGTMETTPGLSSYGRLFLSKYGGTPDKPDATATAVEVAAVEPPAKLSREGAAERLREIYDRGEKWTSTRKMADRIGCSNALVHKAVTSDPMLKSWSAPGPVTPRAASLDDRLMDRNSQQAEITPEDTVRIREYLERLDLTDGDLASFNALPNERAQVEYLDRLEELAEDQSQDDHFRILGRRA